MRTVRLAALAVALARRRLGVAAVTPLAWVPLERDGAEAGGQRLPTG